MVVAAALCPAPPLLVPEIAQGAAPELDDARQACGTALARVAAARPDRLVVLGTHPEAPPGEPAPDGATDDGTTWAAGSTGSFREFGMPLDVVLGAERPPAAETRPLPYPIALGAWLLDALAWHAAPVEGLSVPASATPDSCRHTGRALADRGERTALLVMGDGSARGGPRAPGYLDDRAEPYDRALGAALARADLPALAALDPELADELLVSGRAVWQVLASAADGAGLRGQQHYAAAPYGVSYFVTSWA